MLKGLGVLVFMGLLVVATIGMAGEGPHWFRYVGSGMLFTLLMLILAQTSQLPDKEEYRKMFEPPEGEEVYSADEALAGGSPIQVPQKRTPN